MTGPGELASLLADGERAAFHGEPAVAAGVLERAVVLAQGQGRTSEVTAAAWLLGVALGAAGRYGAALSVLSPLVQSASAQGAAAELRLFGALSSATVASVHRQLGRHAVARAADQTALALSGGAGEAGFDAQLGLASDAIGLAEPGEAGRRLAEAEALLPPAPGDGGPGGVADPWWRQRVRRDWARAELALLEGRGADAVARARAAVDGAEAAGAPRHVAKGLLVLGLARLRTGEVDGAADALRRAAVLAEQLGTVPLLWPARALLGALVAGSDPQESAQSLAAARLAVLAVAGDLPPGVRAEWLARPDITALLQE